MVLKVVDSVAGETTLISIKVFEKHNDGLSFYIWDTSGDCAVVTVSIPSEIKKCLDDLYHQNKATVQGKLEWVSNDDEE